MPVLAIQWVSQSVMQNTAVTHLRVCILLFVLLRIFQISAHAITSLATAFETCLLAVHDVASPHFNPSSLYSASMLSSQHCSDTSRGSHARFVQRFRRCIAFWARSVEQRSAAAI